MEIFLLIHINIRTEFKYFYVHDQPQWHDLQWKRQQILMSKTVYALMEAVCCVCYLYFSLGPSHSHPCAQQTLEDCTSLQGSVRNSSCRDSWYSEKEELFPLRAGHRREDSLDSLDSLGSRTYSTSSDATLKGSSEGKALQSLKSLLCVLT